MRKILGYLWKIPPFSWLQWLYYKIRLSRPIWYSLYNREARSLFQEVRSDVNTIQKKAIQGLIAEGICQFHFNDLFPEIPLDRILAEAESLAREPKNSQQIQYQLQNSELKVKKSYLIDFWGKKALDGQSPFVQMCLDQRMLAIVNEYLEMCARLTYMDFWYTVTQNRAASYSQRWHRDPEDRRFVKLFLYLRDVDEGCGPFSYIPGTHDRGKYRKTLPSDPPYSTYPGDAKVEQIFPSEKRRVMTAKAGTLILCDTSGLHRGGHATVKDRFLFNAIYMTDGGLTRQKKKINYLVEDESLYSKGTVEAFAIGLAKKYFNQERWR